MAASRYVNQIAAAISAGLLVTLVNACGPNSDVSPEVSASMQPPFPYPQFEIRTDVAVTLDPPLTEAAKFALQMSVDDLLSNDPDEEELYQRFRSRIAPEADADEIRIPDKYVGSTGTALHRVVAAHELPDESIEVSICLYDTPGLYAVKEDGTLVKPTSGKDALWRPKVRWTMRPAADGSIPTNPRWLLIDTGVLLDLTAAQINTVCGPFRPDPFVQTQPAPTLPVPTPR